jgi:ribose/xylose/arabinose/galactoside ABC-type transport system permease subunit
MAFGFMVGWWDWPVLPALLICLLVGALLGAVNGVLVAYLRFPSLIATLATYYIFSSVSLVSTDGAPISTEAVQKLHALTETVTIPGLGNVAPAFPLQVITFGIPAVVVVWLLLDRGTFGRRLFAVGTNDVAARFASLSVAGVRFRAFVLSGLLSAVVAVVTVGQFASARPDAGTTGSGMALPAITIAVLGGVAISGGVGRVAGVVVAALLVVCLNGGILLASESATASQSELLALGLLLVSSALLNALTVRRYGSLP